MEATPTTCPSTYNDLLFWCVFFVIPITACLAFFMWRSFLHRELLNLYQNKSNIGSNMVVPIEACVVDKNAQTVHEYRGRGGINPRIDTIEDGHGIEAYEVRPFFLKVRYQPKTTVPNPSASAKTANPSTSVITKRLQVSEHNYHKYAIGDSIKLVYLPAHAASAVLLEELQQQAGVNTSTILFCWLLEFVALGLCATNAWCLSFGWSVVLIFLMGTFWGVWLCLDHGSSYRQHIQREFFFAGAEDDGSSICDSSKNNGRKYRKVATEDNQGLSE